MSSSIVNKTDSVLIVGADGTIGRSLVFAFEDIGIQVWQTTRNPASVGGFRLFLDLSQDISNVSLPQVPIKVAIFCAAVTSIEQCRLRPEFSRLVNVVGTTVLAKRLIDAGAFVVFLSTNLVFNGETPFEKPNNSVNPKTEYGLQKAEAELQLQKIGEQFAIVRFSKILTPMMPLFQTWIKYLKDDKIINPFYDMFMSPISMAFAVNVLLEISFKRNTGIFQVSAMQEISYSDVAIYIAKRLGLNSKLVQPISYCCTGPAFSPSHTTLDSRRLIDLGLQVPHVLNTLKEMNW